MRTKSDLIENIVVRLECRARIRVSESTMCLVRHTKSADLNYGLFGWVRPRMADGEGPIL